MERVAAVVFGMSKTWDTADKEQSFITHIPDDMEDDGLDKTDGKDTSEEEDIDGILELTEGENIWSSIF